MNLPSGLIFFLDFKYGSANQANKTQNTDVFGNTSASGDASGGLYGAGQFGYSINSNEKNLSNSLNDLMKQIKEGRSTLEESEKAQVKQKI